eukprot:TRINITY_DN10451_c0_g1_i1.p1 TRINITY_DN10451_c0_g1~~TRINITY_DN10451_c0_g1_i1.p1  ORF type:complete len:526 (+),score=79.68 TRINITY_DN10451_c0_g1_i1:49-1626(+)
MDSNYDSLPAPEPRTPLISSAAEGWFVHRRVVLLLAIVVGLLSLIALVASITSIVLIAKSSGSDDDDGDDGTVRRPKNLIFMLSDGCGPASYTLARRMIKYLNGTEADFIFDSWLVGNVQTHSSDSLITDSAAGATAYSCGRKTYNDAIAVDPEHKRAMGTILEAAAKQRHMKTGLVATSRITHASPASFASHAQHRDMEDFIAIQEVMHDVDVMLGGGMRHFVNRTDGVDLLRIARDRGYAVVTTKDGMDTYQISKNTPRVLGLFSSSDLMYTIDRTSTTTQPTLEEMVKKALQLLSKDNENGFFLFIEGSRIDHAAHQNDAAAHYQEIIQYDLTARAVKNFVDKVDSDTLVVGTSDHETGGLSLGVNPGDYTYPVYAWYPQNLAVVRMSAEKMANLVAKGNMTVQEVLLQYANLTVNTNDTAVLTAAQERGQLTEAIGDYVALHAGLGWSTWGHSAVDVNMYAYAKDKKLVDLFRGNNDNTQISKYLTDLFGFDLDAITKELKNFNTTDGSLTSTSPANRHVR